MDNEAVNEAPVTPPVNEVAISVLNRVGVVKAVPVINQGSEGCNTV